MLGENDTFYLNPDEYEQFYFLEDELSRGRVEICIGGRYGTVCDNSWDNRDASVVCRQLGFSPYGKMVTLLVDSICSIHYNCVYNSGAVAVSSEYYGENSRPMSVKEVECIGSELTLLDCNLESNNQNVCGSLEDAGIVCQGMFIFMHNQ